MLLTQNPLSMPKERKNTNVIFSKECYSMKRSLLTNSTVVNDDVIKFVEQ